MSKSFPLYIVDDSEPVRAMLAELFKERGIASRCFQNGEDFLSELDELERGCVVLDMHMPRRSGLQVQAEMARRGQAFPVIALTGNGDVGMAVESMKLGAIDFIEKPFENEVLFEAVGRGFRILEQIE